MSMKNPLTPAGIEPATFPFVAQLLNHCATAVNVVQTVLSNISRGKGLPDISVARYQNVVPNVYYSVSNSLMCTYLVWDRWCRDRFPVGARFSTPIQTIPDDHTASYTEGTGSLSWG